MGNCIRLKPIMRILQVVVLLFTFVWLQACESNAAPCDVQKGQESSVAALQRQKDDTLYEIQLRQDELDQMMEKAKGALGVSHEWLERKEALSETITQLKVKAHDLDLQIAAAQQK